MSIMGNFGERLIITSVVCLLIIYCVYWATRGEKNSRLQHITGPEVKTFRSAAVHQSPSCDFDTFRAVARQRSDGYLSGSGKWTRNGTRIDRFYPSVCRLAHGKWIPEDELATCLHRDHVRYVAIIGDSNGRYYLRWLHKLLGKAPVKRKARRRIMCTPVIRHDGFTYNNYSSPTALVKHRCPCGGYCTLEFTTRGSMRHIHCYVLQARCTVDNVIEVVMEYITAWSTIDPKNQYSSGTGCQRSASSPTEPTRSSTTQAFLLGEYFADPRPDVLLVFSNTHDEMPLVQHAANVDEFARLLDTLVPASTRVVWASRHAEDDSKKPTWWRNKRYRQPDGRVLTRLQWLNESNRILYAKMRQRFSDGPRPTIMFPDLLEMSRLALRDLNKDGVHMTDDWYQSVMSFLLQSLCHSSTTPS